MDRDTQEIIHKEAQALCDEITAFVGDDRPDQEVEEAIIRHRLNRYGNDREGYPGLAEHIASHVWDLLGYDTVTGADGEEHLVRRP